MGWSKKNIEIYYNKEQDRTTIVGWHLSSEQKNQLAMILLGDVSAVKPMPATNMVSPVEKMEVPKEETYGEPIAIDNSQEIVKKIEDIVPGDPVETAKSLIAMASNGGTEVMQAAITKNKAIASMVLSEVGEGTAKKATVLNYLYTIRNINPAIEASFRKFIAGKGLDQTIPFDQNVITALKVASDEDVKLILSSIAA